VTDEELDAIEKELDEHYQKMGGRRLREWKERKRGLEFYHIPTTRRRLLYSLLWHNLSDELQVIIANGREHPEYKMRLAVYAWQIYTLARYVYMGKDGNYKKLSAQRYARELFLDDAESPEELRGCYFEDEQRGTGFRIYKAICDCLSPMVAHMGGDRFWPDHVAFLIDHVIQNEGNVPPPDMERCSVPYPRNYPGPYLGENKEHFLPEGIAM